MQVISIPKSNRRLFRNIHEKLLLIGKAHRPSAGPKKSDGVSNDAKKFKNKKHRSANIVILPRICQIEKSMAHMLNRSRSVAYVPSCNASKYFYNIFIIITKDILENKMANPLVIGLALGLATGPLCLVSCGPVYAPFLMQKSRGTLQSVGTLLQISAGRLLTYLLIGLAAGALGKQIATLDRTWFTAAAYVLFSVFLIFSALRTKKCDAGCRPSGWTRFADIPFILGMATGISFCPSLLLALTQAVDHGGVFAGAALFGAFFIGTFIYFIPLVLFGMIGITHRLRTVGRIASCVVALWFICQAILMLVH
jgi:sulfite exporter TauE/SafE